MLHRLRAFKILPVFSSEDEWYLSSYFNPGGPGLK
jgi:hypothetical protein